MAEESGECRVSLPKNRKPRRSGGQVVRATLRPRLVGIPVRDPCYVPGGGHARGDVVE